MAWFTVTGIGGHHLTERRPIDVADPVIENILGPLKVVQHVGATFIAEVPEFPYTGFVEPSKQYGAISGSRLAEGD